MCGIGGVYFGASRLTDAAALHRMSDAMRDRGPDDCGFFIEERVGLVHRRLSVLDLSPAGRNPMASPDGQVQVVHNGEIYNFKDLRRQLQQMGYEFLSRTDTEVILHGYEQWGTSIVERLEGMFAFALWDAREGQLLLARDRVGQKPLYVATRPFGVVFASTLNAVAAYLQDELSVDMAALDCYLSHVFIPGEHTAWKGVHALEPATLMLVKSDGRVAQRKYWDLTASRPETCSIAEAEARVESALEGAVRRQLVADVPVGGFLSGGVDSSLVMALAARHHPKVKTFSIAFQEQEYSEAEYAREVAAAIGSDHHERVVTEQDLLEILPELVWQYGQPFADSSAVPTYFLSRFAREQVTVTLSGDGGDEGFAGYWRAAAGWYADVYQQALPRVVRRVAVPRFVALLQRSPARQLGRRLTALNTLSLVEGVGGYTNSLSWLNYRHLVHGPATTAAIREGTTDHDPLVCRRGPHLRGTEPSYLQKLLYDDYRVLLPDCYLTKVDVASMAASLEVRSPFLDHRLIETAWSLPDSLKIRLGARKWLLKRIAAKHVPRRVVYRRKMGFAPPMATWWRGRLARVLSVLLEDSRSVQWGWIERAPVGAFLKQHVEGRARHDVRLWQILWLELWARIAVERSMDRHQSLLDI